MNMVNKRILAALLVIFFIPIVTAAPQLTVSAPTTVDNPFEVTIGLNESIEDFRALEFVLDYNSKDLSIVDVYKVSDSSAIQVSYNDNNVALVATKSTNLSSDIVKIQFEVLADPGEKVYVSTEDDGTYAIEGGVDAYLLRGAIVEEITLSSCVSYSNTHSDADGNAELPGTGCYCNANHLPTVDTVGSEWTCEPSSTNIYGTNSQDCSLGGTEIYSTGYCCQSGFYLNPVLTAANFAEMFGQGVDVCVVKPNSVPVANIYSPDDDENYDVGKRLRFSAKGSYDPNEGVGNCTDCKYEWDFGDKSKSWGELKLDRDEEIICKATSSSKNCAEDEAEIIGDIDEDTLDNPCVCTEYESEIYPLKSGKLVYHTYNSQYACTEYDEDDTDLCEINLYVTDGENGTSSTRIEIELDSSSSGGSGGSGGSGSDDVIVPFCGDGVVEGAEACDGISAVYCTSGGCNNDCTCYEPEDIQVIQTDPPAAVCGDRRCASPETATSCILDCHCGDSICQAEYGENANNCADCSDESGGSFWIILLIALIVIGGLLFAIKQGYIDLDKFMPQMATHTSTKSSSDFNLNNMAFQHNVHQPHTGGGANINNYIKATRAKGYSYSQIRETLQRKGWSEDKINAAFSKGGF